MYSALIDRYKILTPRTVEWLYRTDLDARIKQAQETGELPALDFLDQEKDTAIAVTPEQLTALVTWVKGVDRE